MSRKENMNIFEVLKEKIKNHPNAYRGLGCQLTEIDTESVFEVIDQVEQEFENDFCEWKHMPVTEGLFVSHGEPEKLMNVESWNFCPYCGKKIKIIY